jgi:hypothetical protein
VQNVATLAAQANGNGLRDQMGRLAGAVPSVHAVLISAVPPTPLLARWYPTADEPPLAATDRSIPTSQPSTEPPAPPLATLEAALERITDANEETGSAIARVATGTNGPDVLSAGGPSSVPSPAKASACRAAGPVTLPAEANDCSQFPQVWPWTRVNCAIGRSSDTGRHPRRYQPACERVDQA